MHLITFQPRWIVCEISPLFLMLRNQQVADLGRMEWPETPDYIDKLTYDHNIELAVDRHAKHDLLDGIRARRVAMDADGKQDQPHFPSTAARYCTAGWKRAVCDRWVRNRYLRDAEVIVAMGLRAQESKARAKRKPVEYRKQASSITKNRNVINWHPILDWSLADVWQEIGYTMTQLRDLQELYQRRKAVKNEIGTTALERRFKAHVAYLRGNERLSCALCFMANKGDLRNGAEYHPALFRELVADEKKTGYQYKHGMWLEDLLTEEKQPRQLGMDMCYD
jgi:3'-phosphoadenosine 5'-phosphosulfate sulfotransferase (PAPS reductase)/FAD synthetase